MAQVAAAGSRQPGRAWLIGNEPDIVHQDWATPAAYAAAYHTLYTAIKAADPSAQVVAGNLSQITPLRLRYLDAVLAAYAAAYGAPMPVDVWGMHAFVLPEVRRRLGRRCPAWHPRQRRGRHALDDRRP